MADLFLMCVSNKSQPHLPTIPAQGSHNDPLLTLLSSFSWSKVSSNLALPLSTNLYMRMTAQSGPVITLLMLCHPYAVCFKLHRGLVWPSRTITVSPSICIRLCFFPSPQSSSCYSPLACVLSSRICFSVSFL